MPLFFPKCLNNPMSLRIFLFGFFILLAGCSSKKEEVPQFDEEQYVKMLEDLYVARGASQKLFGKSRDSILSVYQQEIFEKYEMDSVRFSEILDYLAKDPKHFADITKRTSDSLYARAKEVD